MRMKTVWKGAAPKGSGWQLAGTVSDGVKWAVWLRDGGNGWVTVKLAAAGTVRGKANYWMGWNGARFARTVDYEALKARRPDLVEPLKDVLRAMTLI